MGVRERRLVGEGCGGIFCLVTGSEQGVGQPGPGDPRKTAVRENERIRPAFRGYGCASAEPGSRVAILTDG